MTTRFLPSYDDVRLTRGERAYTIDQQGSTRSHEEETIISQDKQ